MVLWQRGSCESHEKRNSQEKDKVVRKGFVKKGFVRKGFVRKGFVKKSEAHAIPGRREAITSGSATPLAAHASRVIPHMRSSSEGSDPPMLVEATKGAYTPRP